MTLEVQIDGRSHQVELNRVEAHWQATVDGQTLVVDAVRIASHWSLLVRSGGSSPASYEVALDEQSRSGWEVHVAGQRMSGTVADPRAYVRRGHAGGTGEGHERRRITTAMPGRVLKVLVRQGERVTARQPLVIVEAMKMENELRSPADAIVREVRATEGASVEAGTILIVLE